MLHGAFQFDPSLVKLALLYAVICRTDYRGQIPWNNTGTDRFLDRFLSEMCSQDGTKSVVQIHKKVFDMLLGQGVSVTSHMSELFRCIEKRAFLKNEGAPFRSCQPPIFGITPRDLAVVMRAADAIRTTGVPTFVPLSTAWRVITSARKSNDAPKDVHDLNELRTSLILRDRPQDIMDRRRREAEERKGDEPGSESGDAPLGLLK